MSDRELLREAYGRLVTFHNEDYEMKRCGCSVHNDGKPCFVADLITRIESRLAEPEVERMTHHVLAEGETVAVYGKDGFQRTAFTLEDGDSAVKVILETVKEGADEV